MRDWESRINRLFEKLQSMDIYSSEDIEKILSDPIKHWDNVWTLVSLKQLKVKLIKRSYPIRYIDQLGGG